jgi:hypothetical protein
MAAWTVVAAKSIAPTPATAANEPRINVCVDIFFPLRFRPGLASSWEA